MKVSTVVLSALMLSAWAISAGVGVARDKPSTSSSPPTGKSVTDSAAEPSSEDLEFFEKRVRPILVARCHECHGAKKQQGNLRLDSREAILKGGDLGPAIIPGNPAKSELVSAIQYSPTGLQMPPKGKLPANEIAVLTEWVRRGAHWPKAAKPRGGTTGSGFDLRARLSHWSFQPVRKSKVPQVQNTAWPRTPVDAFVLAKLEGAGMIPAQEADRGTLLRRASFLLIGLPPTEAELSRFLSDRSPNAWEKEIDRLLTSPHYGERWGRHWLDLTRYAESRGHEFDYDIPNPHHYRDYVIRSFNDDLPYNQFVTEQLAGDLISKPRLDPIDRHNESILGTGFWFLGEWVHAPVDIRQDEADRFDNMIDVMSKSFLGLTVSCARCHDHKFDPISADDYYALFGFLQSSSYQLARFDTLEQDKKIARQLEQVRHEAAPRLKKAEAQLWQPGLDRMESRLLAAAEVVRLRGGLKESKTSTQASQKREVAKPNDNANWQEALVKQVAERKGIPADELRQWTVILDKAATDPSSPLHLFARLASQQVAWDATKFGPIYRQERSKLVESQQRIDQALSRSRVLVDLARLPKSEFFQNGVMFGTRPLQPGDIVIGENPDQPIARIVASPSVQRDSVWNNLTEVPEAQKEPGLLSGWQTAGRTWRTPTIELKTGRVHYLMSGAARIYAAVDSHRMVAGPLHTVVAHYERVAPQPRWVSQNLTKYVGHRVQIEFSAVEQHDCTIYAIVEADEPPPNPFQRPLLISAAIADTANTSRREGSERAPFAAGSVNQPPQSLAQLARQTSQAFQNAANAFRDALAKKSAATNGDPTSRNDPSSQSHATTNVQLAAWCLAHRDLLASPANPPSAGKVLDVRLQSLHDVAAPLLKTLRALRSDIRPESRVAMTMQDGSSEDEAVMIRGVSSRLGKRVPRRLLVAVAGENQPPIQRGSGRLELARRMTDANRNPLIARVIVNRVWQHHFGRGLVPTPDDFGRMGQPPSHPDLLDWLATEFVEQGWSLKKLHRLLLISSISRMESRSANPEYDQRDPLNVLLHRTNVRRLEGEVIRDAMLALSGTANPRMFGVSVPVHLTPFMEGRGRPGVSGPLDGQGRRSIYLSVRRNFIHPMFLAFDYPIPNGPRGRRSVSNVPAQALTMLNSPFVIEQSRLWSERLLKEETSDSSTASAGNGPVSTNDMADPSPRIVRLYRQALGRHPSKEEVRSARVFLKDQAEAGASPADAWADLCHVLWNVKEFIFVH